MTRFADPTRCPDCRATLTPGSYTCPACHLDLSGELGQRLFTLLTDADRVLLQMRSRVPAGVGVAGPGEAASPATPPAPPTGPPATPSAAPPRLAPVTGARPPAVSGATVPQVLLGLGALTLLVAISLFFAVTWSALGPQGRAVVLLLLTFVGGSITGALAQRDLRGATEAIGLVTLGLVAGDVWAAVDAGWVDPGNGAQTSLVLGSVLTVVGTASAMVLARSRVGRFLSGEVVAAIGAAVIAAGVASSGWGTVSSRLVVAVAVLAGLTVVARLLGQVLPEGQSEPELVPLPDGGTRTTSTPRRLRPMQGETAGLALVTVLTWLALAGAALDRVLGDLTLSGAWGPAGLPLLATGAYAALPALLPGSRTARVTSLAVAVLPLTFLALAPALDEPDTTLAVAAGVVTLLLAVALGTSPLPWVRAAGSGLLVSVPVLLGQSLALLVAGLDAYAQAAGRGWAGTPGGRLDPEVGGLAAPWVLPVAIVVLVVTGFAAHRAWTGSRPTRERVVRVTETALIAAAHAALLVVHAPVVLLLAVMLATTVRIGTDAMRGHPRMTMDQAGISVVALGSLALVLSAYDEWLTLLACVVLGVLAVLYHRRRGNAGWAGGFALAPLGALAVWAATALVDLDGEWSALVVLLALGAWLVLRGLADDEDVSDEADLSAGRRSAWAERVVGVELGTVLAAVVTAVVGADVHAPVDQQPSWVAVYLTVMGVIATVVSLTRPERRSSAGWTGGVLLAAASWVRLADLGVEEPEPYTIPSAVVLLLVGWHHLRRDPEAGTMRAWSSGLGLALVPSLLWVIADPVSLRALVLGLVCLGLVLLGAERRWAAPFVWGAAVGTVLVLRMAAPVALLVGPFVVFAVGGVALLVVGATWERRLQDAERLRRYVGGLR